MNMKGTLRIRFNDESALFVEGPQPLWRGRVTLSGLRTMWTVLALVMSSVGVVVLGAVSRDVSVSKLPALANAKAVQASGAMVVPATVVVPGGASPDGRYEVRAIYEPNRDPADYSIAIVDAKTGRVIGEKLASGGHFSYEDIKRDAGTSGYSKIVVARWHGNQAIVAITGAATAHTRELALYEIAFSRIEQIAVPDFVQNALGRVNATSIRDTAVTDLERWEGDVLRATLTFRAYRTNVLFEQYSVPFSLRISHQSGMSTSVQFESMGTPRRTQ